MDSRQMWMIAGLVSLMTSIGCTHEQVAKATSEVAYAEETKPQVSLPGDKKDNLDGKQVMLSDTDKPFVTNTNLQPVYFEISTSKIDDKGMDILKKNAEWLQKNTPYMVQITGFTDTRGSSKKNRVLAERRALKVRDSYVSSGIPKNRILVKSMGEEGPACGNLTEECLSQSRRAETLIENKPVALK